MESDLGNQENIQMENGQSQDSNVYGETPVLGDKSTWSIMYKKKSSSFLDQMFEEVQFRKRADINYENFTRKKFRHQGRAQTTIRDRASLRSQTRINDVVGSMNEGAIFKESNISVFKLRK